MELLDMYSFDRTKTDMVIARGEIPPDGLRYMVIHICIFDDEGNMLIQKRSSGKKSWPDKWDISVGGAVISGENSSQAAERELFEELGISRSFSGCAPDITFCSEKCFDDCYSFVGAPPLESLTLQEREVAAVRMASRQEVLSLLRAGEFVGYKESVVELFFDLFNGGGALKR